MADQSIRRMPLRQLLTLAEKCSRDLADHLHNDFLTQVADFRDLSRPVRRKSSYPTGRTLQHSIDKLQRIIGEVNRLATVLQEQMGEIRERSRKERAAREP